MEEYINTVIAPKIQGDGGWVEFVSLEEGKLTLVFRAECSKCSILDRCVKWIEGEILRDLHETVTIVPVRKKPFFWDV